MTDEIKRLQRRVTDLENIVDQLVDRAGLREEVERQKEEGAAQRAEQGAATREALSQASKAAHDAAQRRR